MEDYAGMISTRENYFIHQSSLAILSAEHSAAKQEELAKNDEFCLTKCPFHTSKG
jgi:hypothetical protein